MKRFYLPGAFKPRDDYVTPPVEELKYDTNHPELNSKCYRYEVSHFKPPQDYLQFYSHIIQNEDGLFILGTNEWTTCVLTGVFSGNYDFNDYITSNFKNSKFTGVLKDNIVGIYGLDRTAFITATSGGKMELYSTKARITLEQENHKDKFCFIKVASQITDGTVKCLCISSDKNRFIIGTSRGHFECYEHNENGFFQTFTIPYGHSMEVTGVSAHPSIDVNWVSASADKTCLLWDKRLVYPARVLTQDHEECFSDVHWYDTETIVLSDLGGNVMVFDIRNTAVPLSKKVVANRQIFSLHYNKNKFGIVSESSKAIIYELDEKKELKFLYEHNAHPYMINSLCWDIYDKKNTFYVVGDQKYAKEISLPAQE